MTRQTSNARSLSLCLMMVIISGIVHPTLGYVSFIQLIICISCTSLLCALETVVWFYDVYRMWVFFLNFRVSSARFFHPRHNGKWPPTLKDFYTRSYPLHYFLNSWEKASIYLSTLSVKQGNYWYHFYRVFGMTRSLAGDWIRDLPHSKLALYH